LPFPLLWEFASCQAAGGEGAASLSQGTRGQAGMIQTY
jgi:hypothetical protein